MSSSRPSRGDPAPGSVSEADSQDYSEAYTDELIERILENYEFKCQPEIRFKLKHKCVMGDAHCKCCSPRKGSRASATALVWPLACLHAKFYVRCLACVARASAAASCMRKVLNTATTRMHAACTSNQHMPQWRSIPGPAWASKPARHITKQRLRHFCDALASKGDHNVRI
jgi:hypothetical protein